MDLRRKIVAVLVLVTGALLLAGCNTIAGIGEDVAAAGNGVADLSHDVQNKADKKRRE